MDNGDFVVEAHSLEQKAELDVLNQKLVEGHGQILVSPMLDSISISQCMAFLLSSVENDEDLEETRKVLGMGRTYVIETKVPKQNEKDNAPHEGHKSPRIELSEPPKNSDPSSQPYVPPTTFPPFNNKIIGAKVGH